VDCIDSNVNWLSARASSEHARQRLWRRALDSANDAFYLIDRSRMCFVDVNARAATLTGYGRDALLGMGPRDINVGMDEAQLLALYDGAIDGGDRPVHYATTHRRADGVLLAVDVTINAFHCDGRALLVALVRDADRAPPGSPVRERDERFRATFCHAAVGLAHCALDGSFLLVNHKLCETLGYSMADLGALSVDAITHMDDRLEGQAMLGAFLSGKITHYARELRFIRKGGAALWVNVTASLALDSGACALYMILVIEDVTRRKQVEHELLHLANHDVLTGLPNRALLQDRLAQACAHSARSGKPFAFMLIDLDRFKNINDSLGHGVGDRVLVEVARRLKDAVRACDTVARLGGDEFVLLLVDVVRPEDVAAFARKMQAALEPALAIDEHEFFPTASVGISLYPRDGHDKQSLLKNADTAMYRAKAAGRNTFQFYTLEMNERALERLTLEGRLQHALERDEFVLVYQPQVDIASGAVVGMEALLRWRVGGEDVIAPDEFIPIAEECGLIVPLGEWVLRAACAQSRAWREAGLPAWKMAVNLSARQFKHPGMEAMIATVLRETGCAANTLELEITESVILDDPHEAARTLHRLSAMGIELSIDDFGTGYSSLSYLKRFPINALKIDRSFVRDISTDPDDAAIAHAITVLAHSMNLKVVAEGVETRDQLDFLRSQRCDQMQGFYFSRPLPPAQIVERFGGLARGFAQ
jgi:diguanylate cyclase (GGDEF)-like protein/PAS domain S-box-containing protein